MIRILFLFWMTTRHAQSVSWTVGTSVPRFNEDLKLVCTVPSGCCTSSDRIWANGTGTQILNNGNSADPNKYVEEWDTSITTGFSLIIKNLQPNDVGMDYDCQYSIASDKHTLTQDDTWESAAPKDPDAMKINYKTTLTGNVKFERLAPFPKVAASYGGKNVTSDLKLTGPTQFATYFYTLEVSIDMKVDCHRDDRFTLSVVTGTETVNVMDNQDLCKCWNCFLYCFLISLTYHTIGFVCCLIYLRIKQKLLIKGCVLTLGSRLLRLALFHHLATDILNIAPTLPIGYLECPCKEYYLWTLNILWSLPTGLICILVVCFSEFDWNYILAKDIVWKCKVLVLGFLSAGIYILIAAAFDEKMFKSENSQSVESGSSCWPICRVGQDPNTSSSDPEKVRRSPKKESADKKPTGFVRPQPSKAQHLGTDNTGRAEYSAENEMYSEKLLKSNKPRLLPSIGQQTDSPRPLPQMPASAQQGGNQLAPLEKKKKKRKKKREAKQSDEENSTEL